MMLTVLFSVKSAALVVLPSVRPVTPELSVKLDGNVCALPKLLLVSSE